MHLFVFRVKSDSLWLKHCVTQATFIVGNRSWLSSTNRPVTWLEWVRVWVGSFNASSGSSFWGEPQYSEVASSPCLLYLLCTDLKVFERRKCNMMDDLPGLCSVRHAAENILKTFCNRTQMRTIYWIYPGSLSLFQSTFFRLVHKKHKPGISNPSFWNADERKHL